MPMWKPVGCCPDAPGKWNGTLILLLTLLQGAGCTDTSGTSGKAGAGTEFGIAKETDNAAYDPDAGKKVSITIEWKPAEEPEWPLLADASGSDSEETEKPDLGIEDATNPIDSDTLESQDSSEGGDVESDSEAPDPSEIWSPGSCCETQSEPGCGDPGCVEDVCAVDPYCCSNKWDSLCVKKAQLLCADCALPPAENPCCEPHAAGGCESGSCTDLVCDLDPYCCEKKWDALCVSKAEKFCTECGGTPEQAGEGACCEAQTTASCDDTSCVEIICGADPYCCTNKWDALCASAASTQCPVCGGTPPLGTGSCCVEKSEPACGDADCVEAVCAIDPFCCDTQWDLYCVACAAGEQGYAGTPCTPAKAPCGCASPKPTHPELAAFWAPVWYHDVDDSKTEADYFTAINADGDLVSSNNWESLNQGKTDLKGVVYWSVVETETHYFILYANFHPQDWDEVCSAGSFYKVCHENDMEGAMVVVQKSGYSEGIFRVLYTEAHNHLFIYHNDPNILKKSGEFRDVPVTFENGSHPQVYVESGGHGVCALYHTEKKSFSADYCSHDILLKMLACQNGGNATCDPADYFPGGDGIVYRHKTVGEVPNGNMDKDVGYELQSFVSKVWSYRNNVCDGTCLFDNTFEYEGVSFAKAFDGDTWEDDKANPPWAWDSPEDGDVFRGDWFFRPAESLLIHLDMPEEVSLKYLYNPYLSVIDP